MQPLRVQHGAEAHFFGSGRDYDIALRSNFFAHAFDIGGHQKAAVGELIPFLREYQAIFLTSDAGQQRVSDLENIGSTPASKEETFNTTEEIV